MLGGGIRSITLVTSLERVPVPAVDVPQPTFEFHRETNRSRDHSSVWARESPATVEVATASVY